MSDPVSLKQPALGAEPQAAVSLQWRRRGDPVVLWRALQALHQPGAVIGIGAPLAAAAGVELPGLQAFERLHKGRFTMPATQLDLWALVPAHDATQAFDKADALIHALDPHAELVEALPLFRYHQGHDLTGYKDGTENPTGDEAWAAALVAAGEGAGGSFALVQRWLHFRDRMAALPAQARDHVIGRRRDDDEEIAEAPESAHVKRTAQEDFEPPAFLLRRSMPWGDGRRHGLQFIAFAAAIDTLQRQLQRMMGLDDGLQDALLGHSQAETGAFYWCPPWDGRRLRLPPVSVAMEPAAPLPPPAPCTVRVCRDGPLELTGALVVAGTPAAQARLCRCGQSRRKPWCDDSHFDAGFIADGEVPPIDEPQAEVTPGRTRVQPIADGPLLLWGPVAIVSDGGRPVTRCTGPTLCRCGQSAHKPFCDGSHAAAGFVAPA
jgi:putative iron-dependent peroxidase